MKRRFKIGLAFALLAFLLILSMMYGRKYQVNADEVELISSLNLTGGFAAPALCETKKEILMQSLD